MTVSGTMKVTSTGTRVQAAHKGNVKTAVFKARSDNTGDVYIGGDDVSSSDGMTLTPGESIQLHLAEPVSPQPSSGPMQPTTTTRWTSSAAPDVPAPRYWPANLGTGPGGAHRFGRNRHGQCSPPPGWPQLRRGLVHGAASHSVKPDPGPH